jgi:hypothetical protein
VVPEQGIFLARTHPFFGGGALPSMTALLSSGSTESGSVKMSAMRVLYSAHSRRGFQFRSEDA